MRDCDPDESFEAISQRIDENLLKIWSQLHLSEDHAGSQPSDFFSYEVEMMPHMKHCREAFSLKVDELRTRFNIESQNSYFLRSITSFHVPINDLANFAKESWEQIREDKDLNLPQLHEFVIRCSEIKEEVIDEVTPRIEEMKSDVIIEDFGQKVNDIFNHVESSFQEKAQGCTGDTYETKLFEAKKCLFQKLSPQIRKQIRLLKKTIVD